MSRQVKRISDLPEAGPIQGDELLEMVQGGENVRVRADQLGGTELPIEMTDVTGLPEALDERVLDDDPRLSDARVPTGVAGGVLSGQYPNPGFAVPMATAAQLDGKVDKVEGKGLSTNDLTDPLYDKLVGLEGTHWRGTFVSLAALEAGVTDPQAGDYADVDVVGEDVRRYIWDATDNAWVAQSGEVAPLTAAQVKLLYESNPDTNAFTDADEAKLDSVKEWATAETQDAAQTALGFSVSGKSVATGTPAQGRAGLGLGTAATADVTTSQYDNTVNRVMRVGDFGFGGRAPLDSYISGYPQSIEQNFGQIYRRESDGVMSYAASIHFATHDTWGRLRIQYSEKMAWVEGGNANNGSGWTAKLVLDSDIGTAASKDVGTSPGNVMEVGAFGLGSLVSHSAPDDAADLAGLVSGIYSINSPVGKTGYPTDSFTGSVLHISRTTVGGNVDLAFDDLKREIYFRTRGSGGYTSWYRLLDDSMVSQSTGQSTTTVMSQKAVTDALETKAGTSIATQSANGLMSSTDKQKSDYGIVPLVTNINSSRTLDTNHLGKMIYTSGNTPITLTLPSEVPEGSTIIFFCFGGGRLTLAGPNLRIPEGKVAQNRTTRSTIAAHYHSNGWAIMGDLKDA